MSGQVAPAQSDLNIDGSQLIVIENDANGWPQTYSCQKLVEDNYVTPIAVTFYYDLVFTLDADPTTSRQYFEYLLLKTLAKEFGLDNGSACISPLETYTLYPVMLSSLPEDEPNENLGRCFDLTPDSTQDCVSYAGTITGYVAGVDDTSELLDFMAQVISDGTVTMGTTLQVAFLGTQIQKDEGRDALNAAINAEQAKTASAAAANSFTSVGVILTSALCVAFVGFMIVIYRMRRRRHQQWREEVIMATRSHELAMMEEEAINELPMQYDIDGAADGQDLGSVVDFPDDQEKEKYTFDLGDNMKAGMMGIHGEASQRQNRMSAPPSDSSHSEDDSWAQADATLASLEVRSTRVNLDETAEI